MATAWIYHYRGAQGEDNDTPLAQEPYVSRQSVATSGTAASSTAAPAGCHVARIEVTVATRYRVNLSGETPVDTDANDPPLSTTAGMVNWIHCPPGATISLIEG